MSKNNDRHNSHGSNKRSSGGYQQNSSNRRQRTQPWENKRSKTTEEPTPKLYSEKEVAKDLTPAQKEYRENFKSQLTFADNIYGIPLQAFCPRISQKEKEEAATYALEKATERRVRQREIAARNQSNGYYSSSDSDDYYPGAASRSDHDAFALTTGQKQFFLKLKDCAPLTTGFDIEGSINNKHCYCPCGKDLKKWREDNRDVEMLFDDVDWKRSPCRIFEPMGLMQHLEVEGEGCILHYGTRMYLEKLYENYNGPGIGHRCLYKMGDQKYRKADAQQTRNLQKAIDVGQRELARERERNHRMETELKTLEKVSKDLCKQKEMLEEWRSVMEVEKKSKKTISDLELASFRLLFGAYISLEKGKRVKEKLGKLVIDGVEQGVVYITVRASPPSSKTSFSLQKFFDGYYDKDKGLEALAMKPCGNKKAQKNEAKREAVKEVKKTRRLLFGGGDDDDKDGFIAHAMLSTWRITLKENTDQSAENTATDEGGPLKQFKSDCWKQLNNLSIPVGKTMIRLFEDAEGGIKPVTDELLEYQITRAIKSNKATAAAAAKQLDGAFTRAKAYTRAVGRIMFNTFQDFDKHSVPRSTMLPIFQNLMLRGCIPGDDNYERDDILKHIVPFTPNPEKNVIKDRIGMKIDEEDDNSQLWTPDSIFKKLIPDTFIHSRSLILSGLEDGLSLGGKKTSSKLEEGSGLAVALRAIPLEAVQKIIFGKSTMTVEEVLAVLEPDYCKCEGDWEGDDERKAEERREQEKFFEGDFKRYLREEASKNSDFLEEFVQFCTGSNYLPFVSPGDDKPFKITVEFNFTQPEPGCHPMAHTCVNTIRLPGTGIYWGNFDLLREKMKEALAQCSRFDFE